jgi:radical SAM superfamily enzyme YgiQ (UPF0313 family)
MSFSLWTDRHRGNPYFNDLFFPPLGVPTLAGYLKSRGYSNWNLVNFRNYGDVKIDNILKEKGRLYSLNSILDVGVSHKTDKSSNFCKAIKSLLGRYHPSLIGFSVSFYEQLFYALLAAKIIKSVKPETFVVFGGPVITANIERLTKLSGLPTLVDGLVVGDGEEPLAELIFNLDRQKNLKNVPNLYYKDKGGKFKKSGRHFEVDHGRIIVPDFAGLNIKRVPLRVSVGCPWGKCSFCTYPLLQKKYKIIGTGKIIEIIEIIKEVREKYNKGIIFYDDSFLPLHLKSISEAILKEKLKLPWDVFHLELHSGFLCGSIPSLMKKAGCQSVTFGLESISPRILRLMGKRQQDPGAIVKILKLFKKSGIDVDLFIIFGFPSETKEEAMATFDFLKNNRDLYNRALIQRFCLEENTKIFNNPSKFFISRIDTGDKYLVNRRFGFRYETTKGMTAEEFDRFMGQVKKYFPYSG